MHRARQSTTEVPALAKRPEQAIQIDEALCSSRAAFRKTPEDAIRSFLATPPPDLSSPRAVIDAAVALMWCNKSTAEIAKSFGITSGTLLTIFYSSALFTRDVRAAIEHEVSREGSKEIKRILSTLAPPELSQFHTDWSTSVKHPTDSFLKACEQVTSAVVHGATFSETRHIVDGLQTNLSTLWKILHPAIAEILSERASLLETALHKTWIKHWLPFEEWKFYAGRAKERLTLRELGPRFNVSGEYSRRQIASLTERFPPLASLIHIHEISETSRLAMVARRERNQAVREERSALTNAYIETRTDLPENIREILKNYAIRHRLDIPGIAVRCDLYPSIVTAFDSHPSAKQCARHKHAIIVGLVTMPTLARETQTWVHSTVTTAVALETKVSAPVVNLTLRRAFSHIIENPGLFRPHTEDVLTKVSEARATVQRALADLPRAKLCLNSIQRILSLSDSTPEKLTERARALYDSFLVEWDDMIRAGIPELFATIQAHKSLTRHHGWREQLKRETASVPPCISAILAEYGLTDPAFMDAVRSIRLKGEQSKECGDLTDCIFAVVAKNYELTNPKVTTPRSFSAGSENTIRKLIKHAILHLEEAIFEESPAQLFTSYIIHSTKLQLIAMGHFRR